MSRVLLGDVTNERRETCKGSKDGLPIVGLEHLISEEITLTAWDEGKENTFSKLFREGDILFGRRRAYLKKAAVAPFDGICSGDITVIEAIPERILPELLPFIIQNDALFDFAVGKSAGSLSPRVKWENLNNYEFELPDLDKQRELAKILWAIYTTKKTYQKVLQKTDDLVKSQFIEMFGDPTINPMGWDKKAWKELFNTTTGKLDSNAMVEGGEYPFFTCAKEEFRIDKYAFDCEALLLAGNNATGIYDVKHYQGKFNAYQRTYVITLKQGDYSYIPFKLMLEQKLEQMRILSKGTNTKYLTMTILESFEFIVPPLELLKRFAAFVEQADKSKFELEQALAELDATCKRIICENLG